MNLRKSFAKARLIEREALRRQMALEFVILALTEQAACLRSHRESVSSCHKAYEAREEFYQAALKHSRSREATHTVTTTPVSVCKPEIADYKPVELDIARLCMLESEIVSALGRASFDGARQGDKVGLFYVDITRRLTDSALCCMEKKIAPVLGEDLIKASHVRNLARASVALKIENPAFIEVQKKSATQILSSGSPYTGMNRIKRMLGL